LRPVCPQCRLTYFYDPKLVVAVIVEIDGRIVMQQRAVDPGAGKWSFPSGFVDRGEDVVAAAKREVFEEVGIRVGDLDVVGVYSESGETVALAVFATRAGGQLPSAGDETMAVMLAVPEELPELAFPRDRRLVEDWLTWKSKCLPDR
jgi:ADP-ribose pyrophosphatase YjhB (NUDIX family)